MLACCDAVVAFVVSISVVSFSLEALRQDIKWLTYIQCGFLARSSLLVLVVEYYVLHKALTLCGLIELLCHSYCCSGCGQTLCVPHFELCLSLSP